MGAGPIRKHRLERKRKAGKAAKDEEAKAFLVQSDKQQSKQAPKKP